MPAMICVLAAALISSAHAAAPPAWKPEKPIELIAINAPGGGSDRILRIMAKVLQEGRLTETPAASPMLTLIRARAAVIRS